jgi:hypothetical protein
MMAQPNSTQAYEEFLAQSEAIHRKKASAARGRIMPDEESPKDTERAIFDALVKKAQQTGDEVNLKAPKRR